MFMGIKELNERCRCVRREFSRIHLVDKCLIVFMMVLLAQSAFSLIAGEAWAARANDVDVIVRTAAASIFGYFLSANFIDRGSARAEERPQPEMPGPGGESMELPQLGESQAELPHPGESQADLPLRSESLDGQLFSELSPEKAPRPPQAASGSPQEAQRPPHETPRPLQEAPGSPQEAPQLPQEAPQTDPGQELRLQILVAAGIGLFCLAALILVRNIGGYTGGALSATAAATVTQFRDFVSGCVGFLIGCPTSRGE